MKINKVELIEWFWEKFNSCYLVKHDDYPQSVFMFYDPQYIRKLKLANISGEKINKTDITGVCLFEQDWKNKNFYYDSDEILSYINRSDRYVYNFIQDRLLEHSKIEIFTPAVEALSRLVTLREHNKMNIIY